nr:hypothetical protein [Tanacetum cinerariifolium]
MSRDVLTVGSTMRIPLLYRGEYSQWVERFMNYLEEQTDGEAMINSIKNGDQPLPRVTQVSIAGTTSTEQPPLKDKSMWSDQEKRFQKIDRETRSDFVCNDAMNVSCDSRMNDLLDDNNFFIFDDVNVIISPVSKMPFRKKPYDSVHFLETVLFGNNDFAVIAGYGDVVIGSMTIKKVYYVEGL